MIFIQDLIRKDFTELNNIDLIEVASYSGLEIERLGSKWQALCPFHQDKDTKSFRLYPNTNSWSCFSPACTNPSNPGKRNGGGVIEFVKQYHRLNFRESCEWLKENFTDYTPREIQSAVKPKNKRISNSSVAYYHNLLNLYPANKKWYYNRLITEKTIQEQALGWSTGVHVIPVWQYEPLTSPCICVKYRQHEGNIKYLRVGSYEPWLYNISSCKGKETIYAFAGELDALLASQFGLGSFSVINGAMSFKEVEDWPNLFPDAKRLVVVFDKKEAVAGSLMCADWQKYKGRFTAKAFLWPTFNGDDFTDFCLECGFNNFMELVKGVW